MKRLHGMTQEEYDRVTWLDARIARLESALEQIAEAPGVVGAEGTDWHRFPCQEIARHALEARGGSPAP